MSEMLLWRIFIIATTAVIVWHVYENRTVHSKLEALEDPTLLQWLMQFAWLRSIQVIAIMVCSGLVIISYQKELDTRELELLTAVDTHKKSLEQMEVSQQKLVADLIKTQATEMAKLTSSLKAAPVEITPIEDIYSPEKTATDSQSALDAIKKRYEDILVIHAFLKKCGKIQPDDYSIIIRAITQELAAIKAPPPLQNDILSAADGAYKELYSNSSCNSDGVNTLVTQYANYLQVLVKNFPAL
jgi:hypothetical protein